MGNWDGNDGSERDERFYKLVAGANRVRVLDEGPVFKFVHWVDNRPYNCPGPEGGCPMCRANKAAKAAYGGDPKEFKPPYRNARTGMVNILTTGNEVKILTFGQKIGDGLKALDKNEAWGDLREYDVDINKSGTGFGTTYTVTPNIKKPLTAEQQGIADNGRHDLEKEAIPASVDKLVALMNSGGTDDGGTSGTSASASVPNRGVNDKASPLQIKLLEQKIKKQGANLEFVDFGIEPDGLTVGQVNDLIRQFSEV